MNLSLFYPDLKQIRRRLQESNGYITLDYSYYFINIYWTPLTLKQKRENLLLLVFFACIWVGMCLYHDMYLAIFWPVALGAFIWFIEHRRTTDLDVLRLHNAVKFDVASQRIYIKHLNEKYRLQVAKEQQVAFSDIKTVQVQSSGYAGVLYLELADSSKLFLLEIKTEIMANQLALVMRRVIRLSEQTRQS
ncbi:hypothetical protein [Hymenobacter tenuis]